MDKVFLGYEVGTGQNVEIPVFHTLVTGLTQVGKTETLKKLAKELVEQGYTVLLIDVKDIANGRSDFADIGHHIPIFLRQSTEPLMLKGLLESKAKMRLNFQFDELREVSENTTLFQEVEANLNKALESKLHPIVRKNYNTLRYLFGLLVAELKETRVSPTLELEETTINVMTLTKHSSAFKQLVVRTVCEYVRANLSRIVVMFDEAHIHIPQQYGSASKEAVTTLVKEGASSQQYVFMADQTITEIEKDAIKQCEVWLLGRQRELNEAERTYRQLPYKEGIKAEDIMRLQKGFFLVATSEWAKKVYVKLDWVTDELALKVAKNEIKVEEVVRLLKKDRKESDDDLVWKEKYEELEKKYKENIATFEQVAKEVDQKNKELHAENMKLLMERQKIQEELKRLEPLKKLVASIVPQSTVQTPTKSVQIKSMSIQPEELTVTVEQPIERELAYKATTLQGKVMFLLVVENKGEPMSEREMIDKAREHGWVIEHNSIAPTLGGFVSDGILIKTDDRPAKYRLPTKIKVEVEK